MTTIEDIIRIAVNAHDGMKDRVDNPAVAHVPAMGLMGKTAAEQKAGFCTTWWKTRLSLSTISGQRAWTISPIGPE